MTSQEGLFDVISGYISYPSVRGNYAERAFQNEACIKECMHAISEWQ